MGEERWTCDIPRLVPVEQPVDEPVVNDPREAAFHEISSRLSQVDEIRPGSQVAITVGSRGIGSIDEIVRGVVEALKTHGARPFIVPAMGIHGGGDPLEKARILSHLGITEASVGARVSLTPEIVLAGKGEGDVPVYCQGEAFAADAILLLNRIKPHTDFRGDIESGLVKIACVGLGGSKGAQWVHLLGYDHLARRVRTAGEAAIQMLKIPMGLAIVEGHSGRPASIKVLLRNEIVLGEQELLKEARRLAPRLPVKSFDILVVAEMGKDISGLGLDPLVTGRYPSGKILTDKDVPKIYRVVVLDLTEGSEGNASGIGLCDVTTQRLHRKIDFRAMYRNVITSRGSASARLPMVMESDREAICVGLLTSYRQPADARLVLIRDTLRLRHFFVSTPLVSSCERAGAKVIGDPIELSFDHNDNLIWPDCLKTQA